MPSPTICTVSGVIRNSAGIVVSGAVVEANLSKPFIHPADGSLIVNYGASITTNGDGEWSLDLIETETAEASMTISFTYPLGSSAANIRHDYTVVIPAAESATFESLVGNQV